MNVKDPFGAMTELAINDRCDISELKGLIEEKFAIGIPNQILFLEKKEVRDGETLREAGICDGALLQLMPQANQGGFQLTFRPRVTGCIWLSPSWVRLFEA